MMKITRNHFMKTIVFGSVGLLSLTFLGCGDGAETQADTKAESKKIRLVKVSPVNASAPKGSIEYMGVLTAYRKVMLASEAGGTIEKLYFEKGDRVRKGQVLAEIGTSSIRLRVREAKAAVEAAMSTFEKVETGSRPEEIRIAEAALKEAEAGLLESEKNYIRIRDLSESQSASKSEYDSAKRMVDMARARMESARQQLALARQGPRAEDRKTARANLEQAEANLAVAKDWLRKSRLIVPCDGIIAFREIEEGEVIVVPPVTVITQVVDLDRMKIKVSVGEKDIHILTEQKVFEFTVDAFPHESFSCRLFFLSPTADPATRSFPVEFMVEKPDERMADGMTVRVRLPFVDKRKKAKVPSAWLSEENGKIGLFVVRDGKALFIEVTLGTYYDQRVEILSGLDDQELVITNPTGLKSGDPV
ncbi:MAG: efflux RND transporter periplasmic adaptor subunit, partial [Deltaproteobacteria bacterium]|nr:efflux RND transporter periplasmic adaptor subunit [Deltaproteobacteria bacterium]